LTYAQRTLIVPMFKQACEQWHRVPLEYTSNSEN
jgi:hypothetical protein